jgi:hypothetical protein
VERLAGGAAAVGDEADDLAFEALAVEAALAADDGIGAGGQPLYRRWVGAHLGAEDAGGLLERGLDVAEYLDRRAAKALLAERFEGAAAAVGGGAAADGDEGPFGPGGQRRRDQLTGSVGVGALWGSVLPPPASRPAAIAATFAAVKVPLKESGATRKRGWPGSGTPT